MPTSTAYSIIRRLLAAARRRQATSIAGAAVGFALAAMLFLVLLGALAVVLSGQNGVRPFVFGAVAIAGLSVFSLAMRAAVKTAWSEEAAARSLASKEPSFRSALLSALELAREREDIAKEGHYSVALVDAHLERTAALAKGVDLGAALPNPWPRRSAKALLLVGGMYVLAFAFWRGGLVRAYGRVVSGDPAGVLAAAVDPITSDIELTYRYPSYMRREPRTVSGTGGEIRAPLGSEVEITTRADRMVKAAELSVVSNLPGANAQATSAKQVPLEVENDRDLKGRLLVDSEGSYRFRFLGRGGKVLVEGPAIPITVEPDAPPEVRITSPEREIEVSPGAVVKIEWQAEDDVGLSEVRLVVKPPGGEERQKVLSKPDGASRIERGEEMLDLALEKLGEGESLEYRLEALDGDTVSGPKKAVSEVHTVKIYSEAEHRREVLEKVRQVYEELVLLLGDRLETFAAGSLATPERIGVVQSLDMRLARLTEHMREVAHEVRKDKAGPVVLASALFNIAGSLRSSETPVTSTRSALAAGLRMHARPDNGLLHAMAFLDAQLDSELEKDVLYLEKLMDKERADDLVRLAKNLASNRREAANLLEKFRKAPTEAGKKEVLAQVERMKSRVRDLMSRMAELAKGFNDEHMNEEALAEMEKSHDLVSGLDEVEKKLMNGDVEGAMKSLDKMASAMDQMMAGLERTAGRPGEANRELVKDMLAFKEELEKVKKEQEQTAAETERIRSDYRQKLAAKMKNEENELRRLEKLAGAAKQNVANAQPGVTFRAEVEYEAALEGLTNLERALAMKDLGDAYDTVQKATPTTERLSELLEEDAGMIFRNPSTGGTDGQRSKDAWNYVKKAVPEVREIQDALSKMFPDPRQMLSPEAQRKLAELGKRQSQLEKGAGGLERKLSELVKRAPVFPPGAQAELGESRGHMGEAAAELSAKNPQRGHGEQELALDALDKLEKGLEEAAKRGKGGGGAGSFPFPFGEENGADGGDGGEGGEASTEPVHIPGAEAHKVPAEFRKDLLEAMKQGAPERYRAEVQKYYEELVK